MGRKRKDEIQEEEVVKTSEYKNFINELNEIDKDIQDDLKYGESKNRKQDFYMSFNMRFVTTIFLLVICLCAFVYSLFMSFAITKNEIVRYKVNSDIDYKVYLKANDFYDTPYLEKGMVYVASLIDKIKIDYNYKFDISRDSNITFKYKVIGKLVIASQANNNVFFEKEYNLTEEKVQTMQDRKLFLLNQDTTVNYTYYNNLANKFRSKYAVNTNSYLDVYLIVNETNTRDEGFKLNNESKALLRIPLSQQEINITLDNQDINENKQLLSTSKLIVRNASFIIMCVILLVFIIILVIDLVRKILILTNKRSAYDSYINRILKGYDRIIVNIKTIPDFDNYNVIKVESFQELVDVRDNFKSPINYYVITEHQKSEFFVTNNNDLYIYVVKAIDLDRNRINEKKYR